MPPHHYQRRKAYRNRHHVESAVYGMIMRAVVVRVQTHMSVTWSQPKAKIIAPNVAAESGGTSLFRVFLSALFRRNAGVYCFLGVLGPRLPSKTLNKDQSF